MEFRRCTNCVMDTTDVKIAFDENGICDHCQNFFNHTIKNWPTKSANSSESLEKIIKRIKYEGKNKEFDCLIGMSGGIDSSYLLYLAKEKFNLRPLVFHVDAGWNSDIAVNNIQVLVDKLNLELYTEVINWEEMKDLQLSFFKSGVPHIDTPQDHAFFATMYKFSNKYNIKYILTGSNLSTECVRNPVEWMYYQSDSVQLKDIQKKFGSIDLKSFPTTSILWHKVYLPYIKRIKVVRPLNYVKYIKEDAIKLLSNKFGWKRYPQKHFESRFTCFYESYWLPKRFGFDVRKVQFSSLILTDQMTRKEAIEKLGELPWDEDTIKNEISFVASKLDITIDKLNEFLLLPLKSYKDYKSQRKIYEIGSNLMKNIMSEAGTKR